MYVLDSVILESKLVPVDIGKWQSYMPYHDKEQLDLQFNNIIRLPLFNAYGTIGFIYSKVIDSYEQYLEQKSKTISVEDTEVVLETEVFYTSKIEGAKSSIKRTQQIHNGAIVKDFSDAMIKGNFEAVKLLNLYGNRISKEILLKVWKVLTKDCLDNKEIVGECFRSGEVGISNSDFKAVDVKDIDKAVSLLIDFYEGDLLNNYPFLKASIIHFVFETIHPFCDGNGRLGRLLVNNFLIKQGIESVRAVSFSLMIDKYRGLYDAAFVDGENEYCDCTPFIEFMMEIMSKAFSEI